MRPRTYLATTRRILAQLRADRRTVGLIAFMLMVTSVAMLR